MSLPGRDEPVTFFSAEQDTSDPEDTDPDIYDIVINHPDQLQAMLTYQLRVVMWRKGTKPDDSELALMCQDSENCAQRTFMVDASEGVSGTLDTPTGFTATPGDGEIVLTWNAVEGATVYHIFHGLTATSSDLMPLEIGPISGTSYTHTGRTNGTANYYAIIADAPPASIEGPSVASEMSEVIGAVSRAIGNLSAPANVEAIVADSQATLLWDAVVGAEGYNIYRGEGTELLTLLPTGVISATRHIDRTPNNGSVYRYAVVAIDSGGLGGAQSATVSANPVAATVAPAVAPTGLAVVAQERDAVLTWDPVAGATMYSIYRGASAADAMNTTVGDNVASSVIDLTYTDETTVYGATYYYAIISRNAVGDSAASSAVSIVFPSAADNDGDGLIEINTLEALNNIRHNLSGTGYKESAAVPEDGETRGCPTDGCFGYELTRNLDFAAATSYEAATVNDDWRPAGGTPRTSANGGWEPIGSCNSDTNGDENRCGDTDDQLFNAMFSGNGFTIANLYTRGNEGRGLFGAISGDARISNIGVIEGNVYGDNGDDSYIGGLVGYNAGSIVASYSLNNVDADDGSGDIAGGLVGVNATNGRIIASYAAGMVRSGIGSNGRGRRIGRGQ